MSYWMSVRRRLAAAALAAVDVSALAIAYTGNMTDEIVTMGDGNQYRLLTLTSSGTLSIPKEVIADVWLCGGGAHGCSGDPGAGGGGGYVNSAAGQKVKSVVAVVGAATGASSFGGVTANGGSGKNGGSGGGGAYYEYGGTGAGVTTYPFGDTTYFSGRPHCAGGGGGGNGEYYEGRTSPYACRNGLNGGSNGESKNTERVTSGSMWSSNNVHGGSGGTYGGGTAYPSALGIVAANASFYGGGGGGAGSDASEDHRTYGPTAGYQGVIYVRIPIDQKGAAAA